MLVRDDDGGVLRVLLAMTRADDDVDREELESVGTAYKRLTGAAPTPEQIERETAALEADEGAWLPSARALGQRLDDDDKARVLTAAFEVAVADGFVLDEEDKLLATLAGALGLVEATYRQTIARLLASVQR
ncbi:MAG TPA: TerB family tellurite resistance protein [Nannocystaceae bacterium]|nr:TerB family tellurite resistance protein [Nannocystaceae bacterium]